MKKIFVAIMALGALASCSKDETVALNQQAIGFGNAFVDNSTRADAATDPSYSTSGTSGVALKAFKVYGAVNGVNIFDGDNVTKGDKAYGEVWACDGDVQYWVAGADYEFAAVVDATSVTTSDATGLPTSLYYEVAGQKDMLYKQKTVEDAAADEEVVAFTFTHLLSKVKFSVQNTTAAEATNYRYNVTEVKLTGVYNKGDYAVPAGTWSYTDATASDYVLEDLIVNSASTQFNSTEVLLIPGSNVGVYIEADIEATDDGGKTWTRVSSVEKTFNNVLAANLEANKAYNFVVSLSIGNPIQFTATEMTGWVDGGTTTPSPLQ